MIRVSQVHPRVLERQRAKRETRDRMTEDGIVSTAITIYSTSKHGAVRKPSVLT